MEYKLIDNGFTKDDPNDRIGKPVNVKINRENNLVDAMTREGSILKRTEVLAVWHNAWQRIKEMIGAGEAYSDDFISLGFNISGVFIDDNDAFDPQRHTLTLSTKLKGDLLKALDGVVLKKVDGNAIEPEIEDVYDWGTDTNNAQLTPGGVVEIKGEDLKMYDTLPGEEGVVFINQADGTEFLVNAFRTNIPKTLTLRVPALPAGNYRIEVRNTSYNGKTLRTGLFAPILAVV